MINVNQITSQLAKMPDQALQKYAALNKSDPYILALAVAESNRRKEMRNAAQGAQGMMPQPKVADQAVQSMAPVQPMPEDMGIGRLPAGDMNFADGGIVAFADGGDVERYNGQYGSLTGDVNRILQKSPYDRTPEENALLQQAGVQLQSRTLGADSGIGRADAFLRDLGPNLRSYFTGGASKMSDEELARQPNAGGFLSERILRGMGAAPSAPTSPQASYSNEGRREPVTGVAALAADQGKTAPKTEEKAPLRTDLAPRAPVAAPAVMGPQGIAGLRNQFLTDVAKYAPEKPKTAEEYRAEREAMMPKGKAYEGYEKALSEEAAKAGADKDEAKWMSVVQAGLAAAAGSSPYALKNIAEGFGTGLAGYKESLKEFKKAEKERQKAMADIENARRAEARGDVDAAFTMKNRAQDSMDKHNDRVSAGLAAITGAQVSGEYGLAGHRITAAAANRPSADMQLIERVMAEKKIPFTQALQEVLGMKREPASLDAARREWTTNQAAIMALNPNIKTFEDYLASTQVSGVGGGNAGFKVVGVRNAP